MSQVCPVGGWQTIIISSLDERVTLANPVAGYASFKTRARHGMDLGDSEQTLNDLALYADYTRLTAMLANRAVLLIADTGRKAQAGRVESLLA